VSIGAALARAREQAGLTVRDVSERTRIRETIIHAIEHGDYSACGGDFYARGHIRSIAQAAGADPEPLIAEYDRSVGSLAELPAAEAFEPVKPLKVRERRPVDWPVVLTVVLTLGGMAAYLLYFGLSGSSGIPRASGVRHVTQQHRSPPPRLHRGARPGHRAPSPLPAQPVGPLTPASAAAFGPGGPGQGDNPQLAALAIDGKPGTAWHTDWYDTATFGGLQQGTGLLLDLGEQATVTSARIMLGSASGAAFQLRAGNAPSPGALTTVAGTASAQGVVTLRLSSPVHARYLLLWFTRLPQDPAGTFQASVAEIRVTGRT
jgi:transcriptional regulator with XRE-family HTH domain